MKRTIATARAMAAREISEAPVRTVAATAVREAKVDTVITRVVLEAALRVATESPARPERRSI